MAPENLEHLRFPIGRYDKVEHPTNSQIQEWIGVIENLPKILNDLTTSLKVEQLQWPYRPGGWMIKQVVHHFADSHMNSIIRFKLALTEDIPTIKPYFEDRWAKLADDNDNDITHSLSLIKSLHAKWVTLLRSMGKDDFKREFIHPEYGTKLNLEETLGIYAWHCRHHVAHIEQALKHRGSF